VGKIISVATAEAPDRVLAVAVALAVVSAAWHVRGCAAGAGICSRTSGLQATAVRGFPGRQGPEPPAADLVQWTGWVAVHRRDLAAASG